MLNDVRQRLPHEEAARLAGEGVSTYEIARRYGVTRQAVQQALRRKEIVPAGRQTEAVKLDIPWQVRVEHNWAPEIRHLRILERARVGLHVRGSDLRQAQSWAVAMIRTGKILGYDPEVGFQLVPRADGEEGLVRR